MLQPVEYWLLASEQLVAAALVVGLGQAVGCLQVVAVAEAVGSSCSKDSRAVASELQALVLPVVVA